MKCTSRPAPPYSATGEKKLKTLNAYLRGLKKLTIRKYLKIQLGETFEVIVLHRNWEEYVNLKRGKVYNASSLLKKTTWTLKKTATDSLLGFEVVKPKDWKTKFMEFEVQYEPRSWYPLQNGFLPGIDGVTKLTNNGKPKHWTKSSRRVTD